MTDKIYTNGQMQYIMREMFSTGIPLFLTGTCQMKEQIESSMINLRNLMVEKDVREPMFWFPIVNSYFRNIDGAYFMNLSGLTKVLYRGVSSMTDEEFDKTMCASEKEYTKGDRAVLNSRLLMKHPSCVLTLSEYLKDPDSNFWEKRFPTKMIETNVTEKDIYGSVPQSAGKIMNIFLNALSGKSLNERTLPPEIRRDLDDRLSE